MDSVIQCRLAENKFWCVGTLWLLPKWNDDIAVHGVQELDTERNRLDRLGLAWTHADAVIAIANVVSTTRAGDPGFPGSESVSQATIVLQAQLQEDRWWLACSIGSAGSCAIVERRREAQSTQRTVAIHHI